ncbi:MAG: lytic transglycosylase domain-containing protein, partial [bacterium]|nr:lytic transglycosylase domain-containing protein [bacterium]
AHLKSLLKNRLIDESLAFIQWAKTTETLNESDQNVFKLIQSILHLKKGDFYHTFVEFRKNFDCYQELRLPRFLHAIYTPVRYRELVETYSEQHRLDKNLVFALIWQESFFRRDIVSPARANGLMQLMYPTAKQIARRQGIRIKRWDLYTPHINIRLGTDHLRELLDKYDNKLHLVLAAYNAGPHRVDSWLKQFGHVSDDEFIELMPFTETRGYVKNILRNYYYYRFYYGE